MIRILIFSVLISVQGIARGDESKNTSLLMPGRQPIATISTYPGPHPRYWEGEQKIEIEIKLPEKNQSTKVTMIVGRPVSLEKYKLVKTFWGCSECKSIAKQNVIQKLKIVRKGKDIRIPFDALNDLVSPNDVTARSFQIDAKNESIWYFTIDGADAGESYKMRMTFEKEKLVKREVWAGEFPEFGAVVTNY